MSVFGKAVRSLGSTRAAVNYSPIENVTAADSYIRDHLLSGGSTYTGKSVSIEGSATLVPVYSAVSLLAGAIGSLPIRIYQTRPDGGSDLAPQHRTNRLLAESPNPTIASDEYFEIVGSHLALWGNHFSYKVRDANGFVGELWPLHPGRVEVGRGRDGMPIFLVDGKGPFTEAEILHIRGLSFDGLVGLSPIQQAKQSIAISHALEEFGARFFQGGARPAGILRHPNKLSPEAAGRLRDSWNANHAGLSNAAKIAVLEEGIEFQSLTMPLEDAQMIEQLRFSDLRICQLFRIPPRLLMTASGDSMTYSTVEGEGVDFVKWSLRRWLTRIEKSLLRDPDLFISGGRGQAFYPRFDFSELLRGDSLVHAQKDEILLRSGVITVDEARRGWDLNPRGEDPSTDAAELADPNYTEPTDPAEDPVEDQSPSDQALGDS
jgi:HK97 family phage portal protein